MEPRVNRRNDRSKLLCHAREFLHVRCDETPLHLSQPVRLPIAVRTVSSLILPLPHSITNPAKRAGDGRKHAGGRRERWRWCAGGKSTPGSGGRGRETTDETLAHRDLGGRECRPAGSLAVHKKQHLRMRGRDASVHRGCTVVPPVSEHEMSAQEKLARAGTGAAVSIHLHEVRRHCAAVRRVPPRLNGLHSSEPATRALGRGRRGHVRARNVRRRGWREVHPASQE